MSRLTFVGLGLGASGVSLEGLEAIRKADTAYAEFYTSFRHPQLLKALERASGRELVVVDRGFVEDGREILERARASDVVLAVQGDPMIATTHTELRVRGISSGIPTRIIHGTAVVSAAVSASGLHSYKFGKSMTYPREWKSRQPVYETIHKNLLRGLHTLLLMEYDVATGEGVSPRDALEGLLATEASLKREVISEKTFVLVVSRVGWEDGGVKGGPIPKVIQGEEAGPPVCVIVPAALHFSELEAVRAILGAESGVHDNGETVRRTAQVLLPRYAGKASKALELAGASLKGRHHDLLENARLYLKDAETFLANGEDELAMLGIGYAEGLLDSLTFTEGIELGW